MLDGLVAQMRGVGCCEGERKVRGEGRPLPVGKRGWWPNRTGKRGVGAGAGRSRTKWCYTGARVPLLQPVLERQHARGREHMVTCPASRLASRVMMCDDLVTVTLEDYDVSNLLSCGHKRYGCVSTQLYICARPTIFSYTLV